MIAFGGALHSQSWCNLNIASRSSNSLRHLRQHDARFLRSMNGVVVDTRMVSLFTCFLPHLLRREGRERGGSLFEFFVFIKTIKFWDTAVDGGVLGDGLR